MRPDRANPHRMDEGLREDDGTQGTHCSPDTESEATRERQGAKSYELFQEYVQGDSHCPP